MDVDLLVVGGGPAGAMTARLVALAEPRRRVVVAEACQRPHVRPCGEYLAPGGCRLLAEAGLLDAVREAGAEPLTGVRMESRLGGWDLSYASCGLGSGMGVRRDVLDAVLQRGAAQAGVSVERGRRLVDLVPEQGRWRARFADGGDLVARQVVGADGRRSLVRRRVGLDLPAGRRRRAVMARCTGLPMGSRVEMHLGPLGQLAVAPLVGGDANVNLLLSVAGLERLGHRGPEALLHDALAGAPGLRHRGGQAHLTQVMTTPDLPQGSRSVVGPGLALVGDAAGFCDPFTGEGMTLALRGATLLAAAVIAENLDHYAVSYRATIGRRHHLGSWLTKAIDRPWLADVVVAVVSRIPPLTRRLVQDAAGG